MNKSNYLFDACVSHRNTLKAQRSADEFFAREETKFFNDMDNRHISIRDKGHSLYVRCMSRKEYDRLISGEIITNHEDFTRSGVSHSKGFCFFKYTNDEDALFNYETCLSLFASDEVMLVVALPNALMKKSSGLYADGWKAEYCTTQLYITPGMIHHALFNIRDLIEANTELQERITTFYSEIESW